MIWTRVPGRFGVWFEDNPVSFLCRHKIPTYFDTYTLCIKGGFAGDLVPQEVGECLIGSACGDPREWPERALVSLLYKHGSRLCSFQNLR